MDLRQFFNFGLNSVFPLKKFYTLSILKICLFNEFIEMIDRRRKKDLH